MWTFFNTEQLKYNSLFTIIFGLIFLTGNDAIARQNIDPSQDSLVTSFSENQIKKTELN